MPLFNANNKVWKADVETWSLMNEYLEAGNDYMLAVTIDLGKTFGRIVEVDGAAIVEAAVVEAGGQILDYGIPSIGGPMILARNGRGFPTLLEAMLGVEQHEAGTAN